MFRALGSRTVGAMLATAVVSFFQSLPVSAAVISHNINSYSLFAIDSIEFQGGNSSVGYGHIFSGDVGVNNAVPTLHTFSLAFGTSNDAIMGDFTTVVANSVTDGNAHAGDFYDLFANTLSSSFASQIRHQGPLAWSPPILASVPALPFTPGRAITSSAANVTITTGSTTSMSPGNYKNVEIKSGSTVTFSAGTYNMQNFKLGTNVTLNLNDATIFQIDQMFDPADDDIVGANAGYHGGAWFYVGGNKADNSGFLNPSTTRTTNFSHDAEYHIHYYAPNSWLDLGGNANDLFGTYWALTITGDQNVNLTYIDPVVPEPGSLGVLGCGAVLLCRRRR